MGVNANNFQARPAPHCRQSVPLNTLSPHEMRATLQHGHPRQHHPIAPVMTLRRRSLCRRHGSAGRKPNCLLLRLNCNATDSDSATLASARQTSSKMNSWTRGNMIPLLVWWLVHCALVPSIRHDVHLCCGHLHLPIFRQSLPGKKLLLWYSRWVHSFIRDLLITPNRQWVWCNLSG